MQNWDPYMWLQMPTALTQTVASTVHAYMALKGMDSNAQVNNF